MATLTGIGIELLELTGIITTEINVSLKKHTSINESEYNKEVFGQSNWSGFYDVFVDNKEIGCIFCNQVVINE
jgi:hypothetical protein